MITEIRFDDAAGFTYSEPERRDFERLDHLTLAERTQVTTAALRRAVGVLSRQLREVRARVELVFQRLDLGLCLCLRAGSARSRGPCIHQQNMRRFYLFCH